MEWVSNAKKGELLILSIKRLPPSDFVTMTMPQIVYFVKAMIALRNSVRQAFIVQLKTSKCDLIGFSNTIVSVISCQSNLTISCNIKAHLQLPVFRVQRENISWYSSADRRFLSVQFRSPWKRRESRDQPERQPSLQCIVNAFSNIIACSLLTVAILNSDVIIQWLILWN